MIPYACKVCGRFDEEGIIGHATSRCKPLGMVANKVGATLAKVANRENSVANKQRPRTADRHKNKESRLEYARNLMRKRRAEAKAQA